MAKEYDPGKSREIVVKISKNRRGKNVFYRATCKADGYSQTGETAAEAAKNFANSSHMKTNHLGQTVRVIQ